MTNTFQNKHEYYEHIECLEAHISNVFKEDEITVFHELVSPDFHLDVYLIKAINREYNILLTSGMSLLEMNVSNEVDDRNDYLFAELLVILPKEIDFEQVYTGKEKNSWIISMLKQTARFPHQYDTFISIGHTLQATEDMLTYGDETKFAGCVILPSVTLNSDFTEVICGDKKINIYSLFPLYKNELEYKIQNGFNALVKLLNKANALEIIDNNRQNLIKSKGVRSLFTSK